MNTPIRLDAAPPAPGGVRVSDGQDQRERFPPGLEAGHFLVDEMPAEELVAMSAAYATQLIYRNAANQAEGRWSELFDHDEALLMARIMSRDRGLAEATLRASADAAAPEALAAETLRLASTLGRWRACLERSEGVGATVLARLIADQFEGRLDAELAQVKDRYGAARWDGRDSDRLRTALALFSSSIERVREVAREQWALSQTSGTHEPAAALLLAFVALFATVQKHINQFTERHTDFYYDEVLRMRAAAAVADTVHLVLQRDPGAPQDVLVPHGTAFTAGKDAAAQDIVFFSDAPVTLGDARVAALCTLRLERDPLISPEFELGYVNRARAHRLPEPADAGPGRVPAHWPLFGGSEQQVASDTERAQIGLAVASPQLLLEEGERVIRLTLHLGHPAMLDAHLQSLVQQHHDPVKRDADVTPEDVLVDLFKNYIELERQAPPVGARTAQELALAAAARLAALPPEQRTPLQYYRQFLLQRALLSRGEAFRVAAGRLCTHWLSAPPEPPEWLERPDAADWLFDPEHDDLRQLKQVACEAFCGQREPGVGDPLGLLFGHARPDREVAFTRLFTGLFAVSYSAPDGWRDAAQAYVVRAPFGAAAGAVTLQVVVKLGMGEPPVVGCSTAVHGPAPATTLPVVRLQLRSYGGMFAYSLLEPALLREVGVAVAVSGLRRVVLHNNLGRLDPSKPFNPFGPLPVLGSYVLLGSPEISRKRLTALSLQLQWGGLPTDNAGFAAHYAGYPQAVDNRSFRVALSVLRDGQWQPLAGTARRPPLFAADSDDGPLDSHSTVSFEASMLRHHFRALQDSGTGEEQVFDQSTRNGLVRLQLAAPDAAFGHADYPGLLTEVISANVRRKRHLPMPRAPYTPLLEALTVDYEAQGLVRLDGAAAPAGAQAEQVFHLHPYGVQAVHQLPERGAVRLLPRYQHDGNLFIGLQSAQLQGRLTLLFHLHEESAVARAGPHPPVHWSYLARDEWHPLPADHVLSDSTAGFLTSGIVVLELPAGIDCDNTVMPGGLYWLGVGADAGFERFAGLHGVHAQAVRATRNPAQLAGARPLAPGTIQAAAGALPGLAAVAQVGPSFGLRAGESRRQMRVRSGERLRHKQRASLPWDIERIVLEAFPEVGKVKCFSAGELPGAAAGRLLVAVVPAAQRFDRVSGTLYPQMNAIELRRIEEHVRALSSPCARVEVRNAAYERIQVRCGVRLAAGAPVGASLRRVDRAICDFLSPWVEGGLPPRFGWIVRQEDIEARVRALDCVEFVTALSMLHIARNDEGFHAFGDTARTGPAGAQGTSAETAGLVQRVEVRPAAPWSIAVPMASHMVSAVVAQGASPALVTGITDLSVGSNFIIGERGHG
ncbi:MAG: hypothetical protein U5L05_00920 [Rubrivivax sp.]|nr:hypothetical protein [Rubrivivax sp.]